MALTLARRGAQAAIRRSEALLTQGVGWGGPGPKGNIGGVVGDAGVEPRLVAADYGGNLVAAA